MELGNALEETIEVSVRCSASTRSAETLHQIIMMGVLLMSQHRACRYVMNAVQRFNKKRTMTHSKSIHFPKHVPRCEHMNSYMYMCMYFKERMTNFAQAVVLC